MSKPSEPPAQVAEKTRVRARSSARAHAAIRHPPAYVVTRDASAAAWSQAQSLLAAIATVQAGLAASESEGQRRMRALHNGSTSGLEIAPNLWAGWSRPRRRGHRAGRQHEEVADRIAEYRALGIEEFILSGYPHLEEARVCCRSCGAAVCASRPRPPKLSGRAPPAMRRCTPRESPRPGTAPRGGTARAAARLDDAFLTTGSRDA
jgi:alkanesulfonate monooxygenase SsuD/methylene tetrahydromethanopterin reductase-like flavin-dependent oxidoreductase (luciferase family)